MRARLIRLWDRLRGSYWFIPTLLAVGAAALAHTLVSIDARLGSDWLDDVSWAYTNRPSGARAVLSAIAGSMITVAGVVFSATITTVTFASSQLGPRLLTNFMRDRRNQVVLGTFTATFLYCLLVLRTIQSAEEADGEVVREAFVPHLAVLAGVAFAVASIGVLIFFVHHAPRSVHASSVAAAIGRALAERLGSLDTDDKPAGTRVGEGDLLRGGTRVASPTTGYIERVERRVLLDLACRHDLVLGLTHEAGAFATEGGPLLVAAPADRVTDKVRDALTAAYGFGDQRTPDQDALFLTDELVEITARALSPGVNDPFTALTCLDWIGSAAVALARRPAAAAILRDDDGAPRLVTRPLTFDAFAERAFGAIRTYVASDRNATLHAVAVVARVASAGAGPAARATLGAHLDALAAAAAPTFALPADRTAFDAVLRDARRVLADPDALPDLLGRPG